jgi:heme/copper-type cytochrome/quinol oxidase subunit 4
MARFTRGRTRSATAVWLLLVSATVIAVWALPAEVLDARFATVATMVIASLKVRLIMLDFMELRHAPWPVRGVLEGWALGAPGVISAWYLFG